MSYVPAKDTLSPGLAHLAAILKRKTTCPYCGSARISGRPDCLNCGAVFNWDNHDKEQPPRREK